MNMKKLFSLILVAAILSTNLCAFAGNSNPIDDLKNILFNNYVANTVEEAAAPSVPEPGSDEPGGDIETAARGEDYAILAVEYIPAGAGTAAHFFVRANTVEACAVHIFVRDEDSGKITLGLLGALPADMHNGSVKVGEDSAFELPAGYSVGAILVRVSDFTFVGEPYFSAEHTERYVQLHSKTAADFPGKQVLSLDDAGYAVLGDHVICISGASAAEGGYSFAYDGSISAGDVLMLDVNGKYKPVKVSSARSNGDGTFTVQPDGGIVMSDVYDHLQINTCLQPVGAAGKDAPKIKTTTLNPSFKVESLTLEGTIHFTVMLDIVFDKEDKFFSAECWVQNNGSVEVTLGGEFDTRELDSPIKIPFSTVGLDIPKLDVEAKLEVSLPLDIEAEVGGSASVNFETRTGFKFNSIDKQFVKIDEDSSEAIAKIKGKATVSCGPQVKLSFELPDFIDAEIRGQVGVRADCELTGLDYGGKIANYDEDSIHACDGCVDCDVYLFGGVYGKLEFDAFDWIEAKLYDGAIFEVTSDKIADAYWSFLNEKESPYGGEPSFDFTECKNIKYRADISTVDYTGKTVTGIPVTSTGVYGTVQKGVSPCIMYLYPGRNNFTAEFENSTANKSKTMPEEPKTLVINEDEVTITITVRDNDTGEIIPGASVTLTLPDGSTRSGVTDAAGQCFFDKLPQGEYSESASADNYETQTVDRLRFTAGMKVNSNLSLDPIKNLEVIVIKETEYTYDAAIDSDIDTVRVYIPQYPEAEAAINAQMDALYADAKSIEGGLRTNPVGANGNRNLYSLNLGDVYVSGAWLFMSFGEMQYSSGAARPMSWSYMRAFDVTTGAEFEAGSIIPEDSAARIELVRLIEKHLRNDHGDKIFTDPATAAGYALTSSLATWSVDVDGLHVVYSPEWIAPRYVGPLEIVLPYRELKGIIRDEFIPSDDISSRAAVSLVYTDYEYPEDYFVCGETDPLYELTVDGFIHELWIGEEVYGYNVSDTVIGLRERVQGAIPFTYVDSAGEHQATLFKGDTLNVPEH